MRHRLLLVAGLLCVLCLLVAWAAYAVTHQSETGQSTGQVCPQTMTVMATDTVEESIRGPTTTFDLVETSDYLKSAQQHTDDASSTICQQVQTSKTSVADGHVVDHQQQEGTRLVVLAMVEMKIVDDTASKRRQSFMFPGQSLEQHDITTGKWSLLVKT